MLEGKYNPFLHRLGFDHCRICSQALEKGREKGTQCLEVKVGLICHSVLRDRIPPNPLQPSWSPRESDPKFYFCPLVWELCQFLTWWGAMLFVFFLAYSRKDFLKESNPFSTHELVFFDWNLIVLCPSFHPKLTEVPWHALGKQSGTLLSWKALYLPELAFLLIY